MAIVASAQTTVVDLTDGYSVILSSEVYTFQGTTTAAKAGSTTTQVIALQGSTQIPASVTLSEVVSPSGVTVTKDSSATAPTLTIAVSSSVTAPGNVDIPVHIGDDIVIHKIFSFGIAFTGTTGNSGKGISGTPAVTYQASASGTTAPTGTWSATIPSVSASQYLWTRTVTTYTDSSTTTAYSVGMMGAKGDAGNNGKGISGTPAVTFQVGTSGTTPPTGTWGTSVPSVPSGQYLWTKTVTSYTDSTSTTAYSVAYAGTNGSNGADAITLTVTSSNGFIFRNTGIETVLTAHVYKAGVEVTGTALTALGTVNWYQDGGSTSVGSGATYTIDAGDVSGKASYTAQLETA